MQATADNQSRNVGEEVYAGISPEPIVSEFLVREKLPLINGWLRCINEKGENNQKVALSLRSFPFRDGA